MTNLSSPAAQPAMGFPNAMSDIIDSLKRLERIGSENSKTIEKIIQAAKDLERAISKQYELAGIGLINCGNVLSRFASTQHNGSLQAAGQSIGVNPDHFTLVVYTVQSDGPDGRGPRLVRGYQNRQTQVSLNRESALTFASDIANGLLLLFELDLRRLQEENARALDIFDKAKSRIDSDIIGDVGPVCDPGGDPTS